MSETTLTGNERLDVGFGEVILHIHYGQGRGYIENFMITIQDLERTDGCTQVKDIPEYFKEKIAKSSKVTLFFNAPLWDRMFEYNKDDRKWILISEGKGFA